MIAERTSINSIPNLYLAIRFRPIEGISLDDLRLSLIKSNCYGIYIDGVFEDYLLGSDLLLSYSSTAIEEALQNHVPVLQYDPDGKYEHVSAQELTATEKNKKFHNVTLGAGLLGLPPVQIGLSIACDYFNIFPMLIKLMQ